MKFLYPQFLWALLTLALPIIVHLFNFRRYKTIYFSNTRALRDVQQQSNSTRQLKKFLVLISRLLALTFLVLAFAQPYLPTSSSNDETNSALSIYLDNSQSMLEDGANGALLNEAKLTAVSVLKSLPPGVKVQIINNEFEGKQQQYYSPTDAITLLDETQVSYTYRSFSEVYNRIQSLADRIKVEKLDILVLSDFQRNAFDLGEVKPIKTNTLHVIPFSALQRTENIAVDSIWLSQQALLKEVEQELNVTVKATGLQDEITVGVNLLINNKVYGTKSITLNSTGEITTTFNFILKDEKAYDGKIELEAPAPYFDNTKYFALNLGVKPKVLVVAPNTLQESLVNKYKSAQVNVKSSTSKAISLVDFQEANTLVLAPENILSSGFLEEVKNTLKKGGNVLLFPNENVEAVNSILQSLNLGALGKEVNMERRANEINWDDPLYKDAFIRKSKNPDLPVVKKYFNHDNISNKARPLLAFTNSEYLLARIPIFNGNIFLSTTGLQVSESNFLNHKALIPVLINSAIFSVESTPLYNQFGSLNGQVFEPDNADEHPLYINTVEQENVILPQQIKQSKVQVSALPSSIEPGVYTVYSNGEVQGKLAVNQSAKESDWQFLEKNDFPSFMKRWEVDTGKLSASIAQNFTQKTFWHWCVALALLFFMVELLLLKFVK